MKPARTHHFRFGGASAKLQMLDPDVFALSSLYSLRRRKGDGRGIMQAMMQFADEHGYTIKLIVQQYGDTQGMSNYQLVEFYKTFGFVQTSSRPPWTMERKPSRESQPL